MRNKRTTHAQTRTPAGSPWVYFRVPIVLLGAVLLLCLITGYAPPAGRLNWFLEVGPGLAGIVVLVVTATRFPMSHLVYWFCFLHFCIVVYGGYYTYADTPLGNYIKTAFMLSRNPYDRIGHIALGVFPCIIIREVLLRKTPLGPGSWLYFLVCSVVLAIAAFWELLEWWTTFLVAPEVGQAYLGTQGDVWDTHWDMLLALVGAMIALPLLGRVHDRSMARVPPRMYP